jgi:hypothetical protein
MPRIRYPMAYWTPEQDDILRARYPTEGISVGLREAVSRDWASVWHRAKRLGLERQGSYVHPNYKGVGEVSGDYVGSVRRSARHRGLRFELTPSVVNNLWLAQDKRCCYSGRLVSFKDKTASVDRIDPKRGYTVDNIQIVHVAVNSMKMSRTHDEFLALVHLILNHQSDA